MKGKKKRKSWTSEDIAKLKAEYPTCNVDELAKEMGRTIRAIECQASKLKLEKVLDSAIINGQKFCSFCKKWHPIGEFYQNRHKINGYEYYCKRYYITRKARREVSIVDKSIFEFSQDIQREYVSVSKDRKKKENQRLIVINNIEGKLCTKCWSWHPLTDFEMSFGDLGDRTSKCKGCSENKKRGRKKRTDYFVREIDGVKYRVCEECGEEKVEEGNYSISKGTGYIHTKCKVCVYEKEKQRRKERKKL